MKKVLTSHYSVLIGLMVLLAILSVSCGNNKSPDSKESINSDMPPSVSGVKAESLVKLNTQEIGELKIQTTPVLSAFRTYNIEVPGVVFPAPNHMSIISTPINGRISNVDIQEGEPVRAGQELFSIESLEFGNLVSEYLQAVS